jgi:hypothetical protein
MLKYDVTDKEYESNPEAPETLIYSKRYNGWKLEYSGRQVEMKVVNKDDYFRYKAGFIKHIFPNYDSKLHYVEVMTYNEETLGWEDIPMGLFEYVALDTTKIPYGAFVFEETQSGPVIKKVNLTTDKYVALSQNFDLVADFNYFRTTLKAQYKKKGQRNRRGLIFYGPPGNGKTAQISNLCKLAEEEKFRVFFIDKEFKLSNLIDFKKIFGDTDNVFVIEEITERTVGRGTEELLSFMDGEMSWDNSYVIATTNHPEELPWNIIDRPSRFKVKLEFPNPTATERRIYLESLGVSETDIDEAVKATNNMSLDYLKNIALDSFVEDKPIPELLKEYKETKDKISNRFKNVKIGF